MLSVILSTDDTSDSLISNLICFKADYIIASFDCLPCVTMVLQCIRSSIKGMLVSHSKFCAAEKPGVGLFLVLF